MEALEACYRAITTALKGAGSWGERVYPHLAPAGAERPYVVYFRAAGGELNRRVNTRRDAELVVTVKCVADNLALAMAGASAIAAALNDKGQYDVTSGALDGGEWGILTTTQEGLVDLLELVDGKNVWHQGADYRIKMEKA